MCIYVCVYVCVGNGVCVQCVWYVGVLCVWCVCVFNKPPYEQPNRFNFLMMTNHADALILEPGDRRYCILSADSPPRPDPYYDRLFSWTNDNTAQMLNWFRERDLSTFRPKAHAPMTEGKLLMVEESRPALDTWILEHVESHLWPFAVDLVLPSDVATTVKEFGLRGNPKEVGRAFARLGFTFLGKRYLGDARQGRLWAVRDGALYEGMEPDKLIRTWQTQQATDGERADPTAPSDTELINMAKKSKPM